jgi:iron complex transport system substrate-binding protein
MPGGRERRPVAERQQTRYSCSYERFDFAPMTASTWRILIGCAFLWAAHAQAGAPQRIASLNKCADQILVALVDPARIASVSPIAADEFSFLAERLRTIPANSGRGESILVSNADLVLAGAFESHVRRHLLARQGFEVVVLDPWKTIADGRRQIRSLSRRLDAEAQGERLIAAIDAALARSRAIVPAPRSVLILQRRGYTPGDASILTELIRHMGLVAYSDRLGLPHGGTVPLERLVLDPPDYILMSGSEGRDVDQGSVLLWHPALLAAVPPERRLYVPANLTICGGPSTPVAIDTLADEVRAKVTPEGRHAGARQRVRPSACPMARTRDPHADAAP